MGSFSQPPPFSVEYVVTSVASIARGSASSRVAWVAGFRLPAAAQIRERIERMSVVNPSSTVPGASAARSTNRETVALGGADPNSSGLSCSTSRSETRSPTAGQHGRQSPKDPSGAVDGLPGNES